MTTKKPQKGAGAGKGKAAKPSRPDVNVFIAEYKIDRNGRRAAIAAGYAPGSAAVTASRLLSKANIRAEVNSHREEVLARVQQETGATLERTIREIARGAFHDPRKFFREDGSLKPITELDDDTAAALAGFEVVELNAGQEKAVIGQTKKIKLGDRKGYLDMLMKHLGGYEVDNKQKGDALTALIASVQGSALKPAP